MSAERGNTRLDMDSCFRYIAIRPTESGSFSLHNHHPSCWLGSQRECRKLADVCSENYFTRYCGDFSNEAGNKIYKVEVMSAREDVTVHEIWCTENYQHGMQRVV